MCCNCCSVRQQKLWVFGIGGVFTVLGLIFATAWPSMSRSMLRGMMYLKPNSFMYNNWVETPTPVYTNVYLFNWTNPQDFNNPAVKPNYEQLGPYCFSDYKIKQDMLWEQPHITYYGKRTWHFKPELSNGTLADKVVVPNFATLSAAHIGRKFKPIIRKIVNFAINTEGGTTTLEYTAGQWMFDGFYDSLIDFAYLLHSPLLPLPSSNFGWLYGRNNSKTAEGNFTVHTGLGDLHQRGEMSKWKGETQSGYWPGECGKVNGSTGELWAMNRLWNETISVFISDSKRFINLFSVKNVSFEGIDAWRYETTAQSFDNGEISADAKCFCPKSGECPKSGMLDFSPPAYRAPIYLSHPHFHLTDAMYRENTTGLQPDPELHAMFLTMEPTLGIPLDLNGQVMVSVRVQRDEHIDLLKDIAYDHYAPLFTMQMRAVLEGPLLKTVKLSLNMAKIGVYAGVGILVLGLCMIITGFVITKQHKWYHDTLPAANDKVKVLDSVK